MQAILLAAGKSSRFFPYNTRHKSLVTVMGKSIIAHTIEAINKKSGIEEFIVVTDPSNQSQEILGSGESLGVRIEYVILEKPTGMGDALLAAKDKITGDFMLVHSYHLDYADIIEDFNPKTSENSTVFVKKEENTLGFGVVTLEKDQVTSVIEKPEKGRAPSNFKIIGVYFLKNDFLELLSETEPEHYSFEKALDKYAKNNTLKSRAVSTDSLSLKYPWELLTLKNYLLTSASGRIAENAKISEKAKIEGMVIIEEGVEVSENAVIKGPCYLGRNVFIGTNSLIRDGSVLEENVRVGAFMEVKNSLIMEGTSFHSGYIGDSVVGRYCKIGSQFNTANVRLDRGNVSVKLDKEKVETGMKFLGSMIGENVTIGGNTSIMPGVIVGNSVNIGPSTTVMKNIPSNTVYYTEFKEVVEKSRNK